VIEYGRRPARFHRTGGGHIADGQSEWVLTDEGILLRPVDDAPAIEKESTFAAFLTFLDETAAKHPERLGDTVALTDRYLHLVEDVEIGADLPE